MPLNAQLKEVLACPQCKGGLEFHEDQAQIHCRQCKLIYRIEGGIPVMLVEEARPLVDARK